MKKYICLLILLSIFSIPSYAQHKAVSPGSFTIIIDVTSVQPQPRIVILTYFPFLHGAGTIGSDSVLVKGGNAIFKGNIKEPQFATLQTKYFGESGRFYLVPGILHIKAGRSIEQLAVTGTPYEKDFDTLMNRRQVYNDKIANLGEQYAAAAKQNDTITAAAIQKKMMKLSLETPEKVYKPIIIDYANNSPVSLAALCLYFDYHLSNTDSLYNLLADRFKKLPSAVSIKKQLDEEGNLKIGKIAPDFTQPDTAGKKVSLKDYRGKYVLVDFWASWCHPCRAESPNLINAYQKYHDKSFEILSVSLDEKKTEGAWLKAIKDDKVNAWKQVSDFDGFNSSVARLYHISSIPQNFLIDPSGKIIDCNLRGDDLEKTLKKIFN